MEKAAIGVDFGGTTVKLGVVNKKGRVLIRDVFPTLPGNRSKALNELARRILGLKEEVQKQGIQIVGVGIGAPGPIDVARGWVYFFPNVPGWENTPLKALLAKKLGLPVTLDNDANAMAFGESCFGAGRGAKNIIALTLGTGIGGGIVLEGKLFRGSTFSAAEIGHIVINEDGPRCACGNRGCVEAYVGNGYFVREIRRRLAAGEKSLLARWIKEGRALTPLLAAQAARAGDAFSKRIWRETGAHLGTALAGLANVLNPEKIIIGGGIAQNGKLLFDPVCAALKKKAFPIASRSVRVVPAALGVDAGLIGAAALVLPRFQ